MNRNQMIKTLVLTAILALPLMLSAQYRTETPQAPELGLKLNNSSSVLDLFSSDRLTFHNSYSMQIASTGNRTVSTGLLQSTFEYYINPQVTVRGHVGLLHDPLAAVGPSSQQTMMLRSLDRNNLLLGGEVSYRPSENMLLQISFSQQPSMPYGTMPGGYYPYRGYR